MVIHDICKNLKIIDYDINDDMSICVGGDVDIKGLRLGIIPIKFKNVSGDFNCSLNLLESLENCPKYVGGDFNCSYNKLETLRYSPEIIGGRFNCYYNHITNFDGLPEFFEKDINLFNSPIDEIYRLFNCDPQCISLLIEYDVIRGVDVIKDRLEEVFHSLGKEIKTDLILRNYKLI